jgi:anaerobic magnesium-protoporphyrin IX monomethyl ester cyclase
MIAPWPYADLYAELEQYVEERDYSKYNLVEPIIKPVKMTRQEVLDAVLRCYREYYRDKMPRWLAMEDGLKKSCLIKGMKAIMKNSFLAKHMMGDGAMPEEMRRMMEEIHKS